MPVVDLRLQRPLNLYLGISPFLSCVCIVTLSFRKNMHLHVRLNGFLVSFY